MPGHNCPAAIEQAKHRLKDVVAGLNKGAETVAVVAFVVAGILLWRWILLGLVAVGALVVGSVIGYFAVVRPRIRQRQAAGSQAQVGGAAAWPVGQPQQQAVDGGQHVHIHLPPGQAAEDVARMLRGRP